MALPHGYSEVIKAPSETGVPHVQSVFSGICGLKLLNIANTKAAPLAGLAISVTF
jgi:hypothetical protein